MLDESEQDILTLEDRMRLSLNKFKRLFAVLLIIVISVFIFSGMALYEITLIENYVNNIEFDFPQLDEYSIFYHVEQVQFSIIISIGIVVVATIWMVVRGRKLMKELNEIQKQKIRQLYYLTFETTVPRGQNSKEKILDTITNIFPEIKEAKRKAQKRREPFTFTDKKINDFVFDLSIKTEEGLLLVQFFNKQLNFKDLEEFTNKCNKVLHNLTVFRVLIVAKAFDEIFFKEEIEEKMQELSRNFTLDLIYEEEKGFSMIWID